MLLASLPLLFGMGWTVSRAVLNGRAVLSDGDLVVLQMVFHLEDLALAGAAHAGGEECRRRSRAGWKVPQNWWVSSIRMAMVG